MVFSSIPTYLDASNWQQHPNDHGRVSGSSAGLVPLSQDVPPVRPPPPQPQPQPHASGYVGDPIRPGSMAERARLANIPMLEAPLKCPRCESTNTKFCYFNNYCVSQPRHFCKTCKRYWTRGGAIRSVPVGGGCRRNKLSKACTNSKSPACSSDRQTTSSSTSTVSSNSVRPGNLFGLIHPPFPAFRFLSPPGQFTDHYNSGDISLSYSTGLSFTMMGSCEPNFQTNFFNEIGGVGGGSSEQWRLHHLHQFPLLGGGNGFDLSPAGFHHFQGTIEPSSPNVRAEVSASILTQMASIKTEENQGLNLSRQLMGFSGNDPWTGAAWDDFATFCSTSTNNPY